MRPDRSRHLVVTYTNHPNVSGGLSGGQRLCRRGRSRCAPTLDTYLDNSDTVSADVLANDPFGQACREWAGTATELLAALEGTRAAAEELAHRPGPGRRLRALACTHRLRSAPYFRDALPFPAVCWEVQFEHAAVDPSLGGLGQRAVELLFDASVYRLLGELGGGVELFDVLRVRLSDRS